MNDQQRSQIAAELARFARPPALRANEITIRHYADQHNIKYPRAATELKDAFTNGNADRRKVLHNGKWRWAYSLKENTND